MSYGIRHSDGQWLTSYDPDWQPPPSHPAYREGVSGMAMWSYDHTRAMAFVDAAAAVACYRQVSTKVPRRPDGQPNRPLTAHTVSIEQLPEEEHHES